MGLAASAPPPPLCNRVGNCEWSSGGSPCHCNEWPQWIATHGVNGRAVALTHFAGNIGVDPEEAGDLSAARGSPVSYYRPSGTASS